MEEANVIDATEMFSDDPSELFLEVGVPTYNRRLVDKILAAFNHAYSVGETEIAGSLKEILAAAEERAEREYPARRKGRATQQADLWVAFVQARNAYREAIETGEPDAREAIEASEKMKEAYRRWSSS